MGRLASQETAVNAFKIRVIRQSVILRTVVPTAPAQLKTNKIFA